MSLLFCNREEITLRDVVLQPEIAIIKDASVVEGELLREKITNEISIFSLLRWVRQIGDH
jgi:hypothetical protein